MIETIHKASDGVEIHCLKWIPQNEVIGVIYLAHGMGEHAKRYDGVAEQLNAAGFVVVANDHRGHGLTAKRLGDFGDDGWNKMLADMHELLQSLASEYPGVPKILMGHSMGAMLCQQYITRYPMGYDKLVLSGSPGFMHGFIIGLSRLLCGFEAWRLGPHKNSALLDSMIFGSANKAFESEVSKPSGFEWLSRDPANVAAYNSDKLCGFVPYPASLRQMFDGLRSAQDHKNIQKISPKPTYMFLGTDDPVHNNLSNIKRMLKSWSKVNLSPEQKHYPAGRHEMLNETNKQEVVDDLIRWLKNSP